MFTHACITHIHAQRKSRLSTNFPSRKSYKTNNYLEKIRKYRISRLPIRHPAIEKRTRNRRGSVVIRGRLGKVRSPKWRAESNNRTRFVCKPPPNGQQEHTNHSPPPPPPVPGKQSPVAPPPLPNVGPGHGNQRERQWQRSPHTDIRQVLFRALG